MEKAAVISVRDLSWVPQRSSKVVLSHIDLTFEPGRIYGIIGPNGSGKSSLLRHLAGFLPVESGSVLFGDHPVKNMSRQTFARHVSYVPQQTWMDTDFTVREVVESGRNPYRKRFAGLSTADRELVSHALDFTGCTELSKQRFSSLSGGEAQRAVIARAIAQNTPWIFLDEPVSGLDVRYQSELLERLSWLNRDQGTSILIVLHDINLTAQLCTDVVMMKDGRVYFAGSVEEGFTGDRLRGLYDISFEQISAGKRQLFVPAAWQV